jgi:spore coat protein U-like protein
MKFSFTARLGGLAAAFGLCAALLPGAASAGSSTGTLNVSATVSKNCVFTTGTSPATLSFGAYDPLSANSSSGSDLTATSSNITVTCTKGTTTGVTIGMGPSPNNAAGCNSSASNRCMVDGSSHYLNYQLYTTSGGSTIWDDASNQVTASFSGSAGVSNPSNTINVYGTIPKGQDAYAGTGASDSYTDSITMYVNF